MALDSSFGNARGSNGLRRSGPHLKGAAASHLEHDGDEILAELLDPEGPPAQEAGTQMPPRGVVKKLSYTHDAMIDLLVANPAISQGALAAHFGYTQGWVCQIMSSDAFKERLHARRAQIVDPSLTATLEQHFEALMRQSMSVVVEKLEASKNPELALRALQLSSQALGYGARDKTIGTQNNFIVVAPEKSRDATQWLADHKPVIDALPSP